jgi:hypothetical protein
MPAFIDTRQRSPIMLVIAAFILLAAVPGCIDFEKETAVVVFPRNSDEVRLLLVYEGLGVSGPKDADWSNAKTQLKRLVEKTSDFCILGGNWIGHFNMHIEQSDWEETRKFKSFLKTELTLRNGELYRNTDGKLCGYQLLTIRNARSLSRGLDGYIAKHFLELSKDREESGEKKDTDIDEPTRELWRKAAVTDFAWFRIEPGRFTFTVPASPETVAAMKNAAFMDRFKLFRKQLDELNAPAAGTEDDRTPEKRKADLESDLDRFMEGIKPFCSLPWSVDHRKERISFSLGYGDGHHLVVPLPNNRDSVHRSDDLFAEAKSLNVPFRGNLKTENLIAEFIQFGGQLGPR